ncbi:hypothetical protein D3C79_490690 [compost metagenome]
MPRLAAGHQQQPFGPRRVHHLGQLCRRRAAVGIDQLDPAHRTDPGQATDVRAQVRGLPARMAADDRLLLALAPGGEVGIGHLRQAGQRRCAGNRVARIGATQAALGQCAHQLATSDHRAQRHAAGDALGQQQQVRLDAQAREGEALAGAAKARLDFIDDDQDPALVAEAAQGLGEVGVQGQEAAFTLNGFKDERRHVFHRQLDAEQAVHGLERLLAGHAGVGTGVGQVIDRPRQVTDTLLVRGDLAVEVQGGQGTAMESTVEGDDRAFAGGAAGHFKGVFRRFRAAVGEHAGQRVAHRHELAEALHQLQVRTMGRSVECVVGQARGLGLDRFDHGRVAVTQVEYADAADEVDVTLAVGVPDLRILAMGKCDRMNDGDGLADTFLIHVHADLASVFLLSKRAGGLFRKRIIGLRSFPGFVISRHFCRSRFRSFQSPSATRSRIHCTNALILGTSAACSAWAMKCRPLLGTG